MSVLAVSGLSKAFGGVQALRDVSFTVAPGELLALIGPNGAGKSTCFNLINGQLRPDAGQIFLGGKNVQGLPPRELCRLGVGRTFQVAATFGSMTVRENVQVAVLARRRALHSLVRTPEDLDEARNILELAGMAGYADRSCAELSYGDLKRVELAIALAAKPRLLLMDEPTAGMGTDERHALMQLVKDISRKEGLSVLFTEHDMDVVFRYADRVIVLSEGHIIAQGSPAEVRANAEVRLVYLGEDAEHA